MDIVSGVACGRRPSRLSGVLAGQQSRKMGAVAHLYVSAIVNGLNWGYRYLRIYLAVCRRPGEWRVAGCAAAALCPFHPLTPFGAAWACGEMLPHPAARNSRAAAPAAGMRGPGGRPARFRFASVTNSSVDLWNGVRRHRVAETGRPSRASPRLQRRAGPRSRCECPAAPDISNARFPST